MSKILVATRNQDKVTEIFRLVGDLGIEVCDLSGFPDFPEIEEGGGSLEENALLKAREASEFTGFPALADDTGLFVDAIDGQPGVFSSRFAGPDASYEENCRLLLERMRGVPKIGRGARFVCVVALVIPDGEEKIFRGEVEGVILEESKGTGGFGYDPIFYHPPSRRTFAELDPAEKNTISHRAIAMRKAVHYLSLGIKNNSELKSDPA